MKTTAALITALAFAAASPAPAESLPSGPAAEAKENGDAVQPPQGDARAKDVDDGPLRLTSFADAAEYCRGLVPSSSVTFTVEPPPDEPPPRKPPKTKAARKRLEEQRQARREKAMAEEIARLREAHESNRAVLRQRKFALRLPWTDFSDLLEIQTVQDVAPVPVKLKVKVTLPPAPPPAQGAGASMDGDGGAPRVQYLERTEYRSVAYRRITSLGLVLGRAIPLFDGRGRLFDLGKGRMDLHPTEKGAADRSLERALRSGKAVLSLKWRAAASEETACAVSHTGDLAISADYLEAAILDGEGSVLASSIPPPVEAPGDGGHADGGAQRADARPEARPASSTEAAGAGPDASSAGETKGTE